MLTWAYTGVLACFAARFLAVGLVNDVRDWIPNQRVANEVRILVCVCSENWEKGDILQQLPQEYDEPPQYWDIIERTGGQTYWSDPNNRVK